MINHKKTCAKLRFSVKKEKFPLYILKKNFRVLCVFREISRIFAAKNFEQTEIASRIIKEQKIMLDKQILKDQQGAPMGVFIPIQSWNDLILQYPEIETLDTDKPQLGKNVIDTHLDMAQSFPEPLKTDEVLFEIFEEI